MRKLLVVVCVVALGGLACGSIANAQPSDPARDLELPQEAAVTLSGLISISARWRLPGIVIEPRGRGRGRMAPFGGELGSEREPFAEALQDFDEQLERLASQVDDDIIKKCEPFAGRRLECNLIDIALDRRRRPKVYKALLEHYGRPAKPGAVALRPRDNSEHSTEEYRIFWEYCALAPAAHPLSFMRSSSLPRTALSRIHDDRSLPVLTFDFRIQQVRILFSAEDASAKSEMQYGLATIAACESRLALDALFQCLAMVEQCHPYDSIEFGSGSAVQHLASSIGKPKIASFRELVTALLAKRQFRLSTDVSEGWQQVLEKYPVERLSAADREVVQRALATYTKQD
jgi:hypothetical protein